VATAEHTLAQLLARSTREGQLYERLENGRVRCFACGHRCVIPPGRDGICRVRFNEGGTLKVPFGYVAGLQLDPVEKKPFFHALPGSRALSFGMLGCDYHCGYCQNWITSQALRDKSATAPSTAVTPREIVSAAKRAGARIVTSTYNEPLITSEWAVEVFRHAKAEGEAAIPALASARAGPGPNCPCFPRRCSSGARVRSRGPEAAPRSSGGRPRAGVI